MLAVSETEAATDALTGLGNRRKLMVDLSEALETDEPVRPLVLAIFDLDGFKAYNDTFGHPAGDALLARLGRRLMDVLPAGAEPYRMGGDEFCLLAPLAPDAVDVLVETAARALSEHGDGFTVTSSYGSVRIPEEARDAPEALALADERMYRHKHGGRVAPERQTSDALLQGLAERHPELGPHGSEVAALAEAVARRLAVPTGELRTVRLAAELHDIGKVAIPTAILAKPGPLDEAEWAFMRRHTVVGERILLAAPALGEVARIVRATHERMDGTGYPDRVRGEAIPLAARIIAVCDAYDAMRTDRPYQAQLGHDAALAELRRCAGTQFDPEVVAAFAAVLEERAAALELAPA
jgi:diguanylate cyclase (GGDEF)-like protein